MMSWLIVLQAVGAVIAPVVTYSLDPAATVVAWRGTKALGLGSHAGIVRVAAGAVTMRGADLVGGVVTIDMRTIEVTDIPVTDPIPRERVRAHLSDEDFFHVARYPTATLRVRSASRQVGRYDVDADLTIRDVTKRIRFPMYADEVSEQTIRARGELSLDRHEWGVSFRGHIRNQLVDDRFTLRISIVARADRAPAADQDCDGCGVREAPRQLTSSARIAPAGEAGELLVITGRVVHADGKTPVPDVVVYTYHTNAAGVYPKRGDETDYARRHGYLRGWVRTDASGRYEFRTIRPGRYPGRTEPAHVHMEIRPPGTNGYWIDDIVDAADPLVDVRYRAGAENRGGSGIRPFERRGDGSWHVVRDIVLPSGRAGR